jgi:hypothetical protein
MSIIGFQLGGIPNEYELQGLTVEVLWDKTLNSKLGFTLIFYSKTKLLKKHIDSQNSSILSTWREIIKKLSII